MLGLHRFEVDLALVQDDQCYDADCGLNALQMRGLKAAEEEMEAWRLDML